MNQNSSIPMVDLTPLHRELRPLIDEAMADILERGDFVGGAAVGQFESEAASYLNVEHAIGVASGTDALAISLKVAGVGPGDEVITTPFTFWATAEAIHSVGARAVYVDISPSDMNIDPAKIESAISTKTRAILPVHIFGQCADMEAVIAIADSYGLVVIEDAAQAFGARWRQRRAGSFGVAGCFSFYPSKPLGCFGDGGLVVTNDSNIADQLRLFNNHGAVRQNRHAAFGWGSRLDTLQAAVLRVKLSHLDAHLQARRELAENYRALLSSVPVELPLTTAGAEHCFAQFTIRCDDRNGLQGYLAQAEIATAIHYPIPLYRQQANGGTYSDLRLANTETCSARCLSLPIYQGLGYDEQVRVCERISDFF